MGLWYIVSAAKLKESFLGTENTLNKWYLLKSLVSRKENWAYKYEYNKNVCVITRYCHRVVTKEAKSSEGGILHDCSLLKSKTYLPLFLSSPTLPSKFNSTQQLLFGLR